MQWKEGRSRRSHQKFSSARDLSHHVALELKRKARLGLDAEIIVYKRRLDFLARSVILVDAAEGVLVILQTWYLLQHATELLRWDAVWRGRVVFQRKALLYGKPCHVC